MKKLLLLLLSASLLVLVSSCTTIGFARLPSNDKLYISGSSENGFVLSGKLDYPYQPIGYVNMEANYFTPFAFFGMLWNKYHYLEKALVENLSQKAVTKWGADGIVDLKWHSTSGVFTVVQITGLVVKRK